MDNLSATWSRCTGQPIEANAVSWCTLHPAPSTADRVKKKHGTFSKRSDRGPLHLKGLPGSLRLPSGSNVSTPPSVGVVPASIRPLRDGPLWMVPVATRHLLRAAHVRALCLADNCLTDDDVALICQGARSLPHLEKLDLSQNTCLTSRGLAALSQLLDTRPVARRHPQHILAGAGHAALQELHLDGVPIRDSGARVLCTALTANDTLRLLSACRCGVGSGAGQGLHNVLFQNHTLQSLFLSNNWCATLCNVLMRWGCAVMCGRG